MNLESLSSPSEYQQALKRLDKLFHAMEGSNEQKELNILVKLIKRYEAEIAVK